MARTKAVNESNSTAYYVFSTLANDQIYREYIPGPGGMSIPGRSVFIAGGAGVASDRFITPQGVMTAVTQEEHDFLVTDASFKDHMDRGFLKIEKKAYDIEKAVADMDRMDPSRPVTPNDFEAREQAEIKGKDDTTVSLPYIAADA